MKPEELQIGDIVMCEVYFFDDDTDKEWYEKHPIRINGVSENSDLWLDGRECMYIGEYLDGCDNEDMGEFEPMPLTKDILKANGFVCDGSLVLCPQGKELENRCYIECWCRHNGEVRMVDMLNYDRQFSILKSEHIYVHELQHALRLIGLDKLANNFKIK